jgi:hypothetical protein
VGRDYKRYAFNVYFYAIHFPVNISVGCLVSFTAWALAK